MSEKDIEEKQESVYTVFLDVDSGRALPLNGIKLELCQDELESAQEGLQ